MTHNLPDFSFSRSGPDGNVYAIIANVVQLLRKKRRITAAITFQHRAFECKRYDDVLALCREYVTLTITK